MNESWKRHYVARYAPDNTIIGKEHWIETIINDRAVAYCGKKLAQVTSRGRLELTPTNVPITAPVPEQCHTCAGR